MEEALNQARRLTPEALSRLSHSLRRLEASDEAARTETPALVNHSPPSRLRREANIDLEGMSEASVDAMLCQLYVEGAGMAESQALVKPVHVRARTALAGGYAVAGSTATLDVDDSDVDSVLGQLLDAQPKTQFDGLLAELRLAAVGLDAEADGLGWTEFVAAASTAVQRLPEVAATPAEVVELALQLLSSALQIEPGLHAMVPMAKASPTGICASSEQEDAQ